MSDGPDASETLASLRTSLQSVEDTLKPLLDRKWAETTGSLGTLERAKMDVLVSYAINDLIWGEQACLIGLSCEYELTETVYLKMKGVDPSKHDVSTELVRCAIVCLVLERVLTVIRRE